MTTPNEKMKKIYFKLHPAIVYYTCSEPKDQSGDYYRSDAVDTHIAALLNRVRDVEEENGRLRARIEEVEGYGREYIEKTDPWIACGDNDDPAGQHCGWCRACLMEQVSTLQSSLEVAEARAKAMAEAIFNELTVASNAPNDGWRMANLRTDRFVLDCLVNAGYVVKHPSEDLGWYRWKEKTDDPKNL